MIAKAPNRGFFSKFKTGVKVVLFLETIGFVGSYCVWLRLNKDQDFRFYINENYPSILEGFYQIGEKFDKDALARIRSIDLAAFEVKRTK